MASTATVEAVSVEQLSTLLESLDWDAVLGVVEHSRDSAVPPGTMITDLLAPALADLDKRWAANELSAAGFKAAMALARVAFHRACSPVLPSGSDTVAVCCPEGDGDELSAEMLAELIRGRGWRAEYIGGSLSATHIRAHLSRRRPEALLVCCTTPCSLPGAARIIDEAHDSEVPVIVAGAGFGPDNLRALRLGAAGWAATADDAAGMLREWSTDPPPRSAARGLAVDYLGYEVALADTRSGALEALRLEDLRYDDDITDRAPTNERIDLLMQHLGAALVVDDGRLFLDFLSWRLAYYGARGIGPERLFDSLVAVSSGLPAQPAKARRFLEDGLRHLEWAAQTPRGEHGHSQLARVAFPSSPRLAADPAQAADGPDAQQGQVFADLLFVAAMSCHVPMALISVAQPDGQWSTLSYGVDRRDALNDPRLFEAIAERTDPLEITDFERHPELADGPLCTGPLMIRYAYGVPLRSRRSATLGVLCVLDRRVRELSSRERQAVSAISRQVAGQLVLWRRSAQPKGAVTPHPAERRANPNRLGPDGALVDLLGVRNGVAVDQALLRSHEVAVLFDVTERTVINWAASKKLPSIRTAGGHLRFRSEHVLALLAGAEVGDKQGAV